MGIIHRHMPEKKEPAAICGAVLLVYSLFTWRSGVKLISVVK